MAKDTLVLKNGTSITLETGASLGDLQVLSADREAMLSIWGQLTQDNLTEVQVKTGEGLTVGRYTDLILVSETSIVKEDGSVLTTFCLREKTTEEKRLDALEEGQEVQDGAIGDLGAITSALAEGSMQ